MLNSEIRKTQLLRRQLTDAIVQAENLQKTRQFERDTIAFGRFSKELVEYILRNTQDEEVIEMAQSVPLLDISRVKRRYWYHYLIYPLYVSTLVDEDVKQEIMILVDEIRDKFLQILLKLESNG